MLSPWSTAQPVLAMAERKKQIALRLSPKLYAEIAAWAEEDFRSINGQVVSADRVRPAEKTGRYIPDSISEKNTLEKKSTHLF